MKEGGGEWMGYVKGSKVVVDLCNTTHENGQPQQTTRREYPRIPSDVNKQQQAHHLPPSFLAPPSPSLPLTSE